MLLFVRHSLEIVATEDGGSMKTNGIKKQKLFIPNLKKDNVSFTQAN